MIVGVISGTDVGGGAATVVVPASSLTTPQAFQQVITDNPGGWLTVPASAGTIQWDMLTYGAEVDLSTLGGLTFQPGVEFVWNNPSRGLFKAFETDGLIVEGLKFRQEFLSSIARPDIAWTHTLNAAGDTVTAVNTAMIAWINAWNAAYGVSISNSETSILTFKQRWDAVYTSTPFAALGQVSAAGRPSGILLDGCSRTQILGIKGNNCVALINDQGGTRTGYTTYGFGTYVDALEVPNDVRFGYLGKGVATTIDRVTCNTNGTRDTGGAPHGVYVAGSADAGNVNTALQIKSVQARFWGIGPFIKAREASLLLGPMVGQQVQSMLGLVHCTGSVGPITSVDQVLNTTATGSGSKFVANLTDCYDMTVGRISAQQRASTVSVSQDSLRAVDINGANRVHFDGIDVTCNRLSSAGAMVRVALANECTFGPGSLLNTGDTTAAMYEFPVDGTVGGPSIGNQFAPVRCSANATIANISGSSRGNIFEVDARLLTDGYTEGTTIDDESFGASNQINLTNGVRLVPLSAAPSFLTRSNATLVMTRAGDEDDETVIDEDYGTNFTNGQTVTTPGSRVYTMRTTLTGSGDEVKIATVAEGGLTTSIKRLRAAINNELLGGVGSGVIWNTTGIHATFSAISAGRTMTVYAKTAGAASDGQSVSISGTGGAWTSSTTTGGDGVDRKLFGARLAYTTAGSALTVAMPATAETGETLEQVIVDQVGGSLKIQTSGGTPISTVTRSDAPVRHVYDSGWVLDHVPGGFLDFNLFGAVGDGSTNCSTAFANALAQAAEERLTVQILGGPDKIYYWPDAPGSVINAAVSNIKSVTYDWISLEAVGGPVTILCGTETTAAATSAGKGASTKAFLKANSSTGGTFQLKGTFIIDGNKNPGTSTFSTFSGADVNAAAALEVTGYDQFLFDDLRIQKTYGNADMRADPDYTVSGVPTYNATNNPLGSLYRGGVVIDDNGLVKGKLTVGSVWREGPFITASNVRREIEFEYINDVAYATRQPVSTPLNAFGRQNSSADNKYGPEDADQFTHIKIGKVSGPWLGSLVNLAGQGDFILEGTSEITGVVPTTTITTDDSDSTQYGPGIDFGNEINFGVTRSLECRNLSFRDNNRYTLAVTRTSSANKLLRLTGDIAVKGGWSGPNIQNVDFVDLNVRVHDICDYLSATSGGVGTGSYGTALRLYNVAAGEVRVDLNGALQVGAAKSRSGLERRYSGCRVSGKIEDFSLACISDNNVSIASGNADNTHDSLYGDLDVVTSVYTTASDSNAIVRIGRENDCRVRRADIAGVRLDGIPLRNADRVTIYAARIASDREPLVRNITGANYYPPPGYSFGAGTKTLAADTLYLVPWDGNLKTQGIGIEVTGAVASSNLRVGLYRGTPEGSFVAPSLLLGDLVEESGAISSATTGIKNLTWSTAFGSRRRLRPNMWLALVASHAITVRAYTTNAAALQAITGVAALTDTTAFTHWTGTHTFGALPTTIPTMTGQTSDAPMIHVRRG